MRALIVNADDFGLSAGINRGIILAHEHGIVTSASLMVRWPAAAEAAAYARTREALSVGLHVDLGEWRYNDGEWTPLYEVLHDRSEAATRREIERQLEAFRALVGRDPTHVDSHQHVHRDEPVRSVVIDLAGALGVPVRSHSAGVGYCGAFYGQTAEGLPYHDAITAEALMAVIAGLSDGVTELGCHPGEAAAHSVYGIERDMEVRALCDPRVRAAIAAGRVRLCSFADRAGARHGD